MGSVEKACPHCRWCHSVGWGSRQNERQRIRESIECLLKLGSELQPLSFWTLGHALPSLRVSGICPHTGNYMISFPESRTVSHGLSHEYSGSPADHGLPLIYPSQMPMQYMHLIALSQQTPPVCMVKATDNLSFLFLTGRNSKGIGTENQKLLGRSANC